LDDLVLDISGFAKVHPGGAFVLRHNIGRDVSKFFYGGYSMENKNFPKPFTHSNMARKVVNSIIVGTLEAKAPEGVYKIIERAKVNDSTHTITFKSVSDVPSKARLFYKDLSMIGKHFLIRDVKKPRVRRHYTISNCMKPDVYVKYTRMIKEYLENDN
jgi:hypothetical protein